MSEFFNGFIHAGPVSLWTFIAYNLMMLSLVLVSFTGVVLIVRRRHSK